jgi:hypothetical protein
VSKRMMGQFFQHGYATTDIEHAKRVFAEDYGVKSFFQFDSSLELKTPRGVEHADLKIALAFVDNLQVELIEPSGPGARIYTETLPTTGFGLVLHHLAFMLPGPIDTWHEFRAGVGNDKHPLAIEGDLGFVKFLYLDERPRLGKYLEYLWAERDIHAHVPRN